MAKCSCSCRRHGCCHYCEAIREAATASPSSERAAVCGAALFTRGGFRVPRELGLSRTAGDSQSRVDRLRRAALTASGCQVRRKSADALALAFGD
jgi:hypothetical protein